MIAAAAHAGRGGPVSAPTLKVATHGLSASVVRARKVHWCCDRRRECAHKIDPGQLYLRSVMFPNHEFYCYVDPVTSRPLRRPIAHDLCLPCAADYDDIGDIAREALAAPVVHPVTTTTTEGETGA